MILHGDSLEKLKDLADNSVDSIVTDPPYGLSFMNKHWDYDVPTVELWREALRVLKPGGHLLSFGGTRTYHRLAVAIEDGGFEIRDQIQWLYGSGFPKSHDVSKAIDREAGAAREVVGIDTSKLRPNRNKYLLAGQAGGGGKLKADNGATVSAPATDAAKTWAGWGSALKPANEPIVLARKPLSEKTLAKNVLKWGTGGLNIDASRIDGAPRTTHKDGNKITNSQGMFTMGQSGFRPDTPAGRFPANLILDEHASALLDAQSGVSKSPDKPIKRKATWGTKGIYGSAENQETAEYGDSGGASRFFYCAKSSKSERNFGLEGMPQIKVQDYADGTKRKLARHSEDETHPNLPRANHHPTVKPIRLMEYLIRLVTPPGGTVLDPFAGSGSTLVAAKRLGFSFVGIERELEYVEIIRRRVDGTEKVA